MALAETPVRSHAASWSVGWRRVVGGVAAEEDAAGEAFEVGRRDFDTRLPDRSEVGVEVGKARHQLDDGCFRRVAAVGGDDGKSRVAGEHWFQFPRLAGGCVAAVDLAGVDDDGYAVLRGRLPEWGETRISGRELANGAVELDDAQVEFDEGAVDEAFEVFVAGVEGGAGDEVLGSA